MQIQPKKSPDEKTEFSLFSDRKKLEEYKNFYAFSKSDLTSLINDEKGANILLKFIDSLTLLETSCKRNGWDVTEEIRVCAVALLKLVMQLIYEENDRSSVGVPKEP